MSRCELVRVRAEDLEPGRRVRLPQTRRLSAVISVEAVDWVRCAVSTEEGVIVVGRKSFLDAEDSESEVMAP